MQMQVVRAAGLSRNTGVHSQVCIVDYKVQQGDGLNRHAAGLRLYVECPNCMTSNPDEQVAWSGEKAHFRFFRPAL